MRNLILVATAAIAMLSCSEAPPADSAETVDNAIVDANMVADENAASMDANMSDASPSEATTDTMGTRGYSGGDEDDEEVADNTGDDTR